ncbi:hypothetical protein M378DRAFT_165303 [Amanita muscaria Koide BX008]|uniref:Uncharacterized protein n=1 Tax=Amanita muscaria (strain Koide BX008) TaxID=946122 RepID=A0A0C2WMM7_AMAMK|nr:hypothetical protein M378DRAFT_165303 [Amanita muscaria Koide BX008]
MRERGALLLAYLIRISFCIAQQSAGSLASVLSVQCVTTSLLHSADAGESMAYRRYA